MLNKKWILLIKYLMSYWFIYEKGSCTRGCLWFKLQGVSARSCVFLQVRAGLLPGPVSTEPLSSLQFVQ